MVYVIPIVDLSPSEGFVLSAVTPSGGRESCLGCVAGTLLEAPDDSLVTSGLAEAGPPEDPPTTDEERVLRWRRLASRRSHRVALLHDGWLLLEPPGRWGACQAREQRDPPPEL